MHSRAAAQVMPTTQTNVLLAALEKDVVLVDYAKSKDPQLRIIASAPEDHGKPSEGWRFNDAKASPGGALVAGRFACFSAHPDAWSVYFILSGALTFGTWMRHVANQI